MVGKRERVGRLLDAVGFSRAVTALRARMPPTWVSVLTYHRVGEPSDALGGDMFDARPDQFDAQLEHLARHFNFVRTEDIIGMLDGRPLPKNPVMVTFDDGYTDNIETVVPMLKRHGATATFFVATDYVERRRLFWWDRISLMVARSDRERIEINYPRKLAFDRSEAAAKLIIIVKTEFGLDLEPFLDHVSERTGVTIPADEERSLVDDLIMTWDQIRALADEGMDVQSHTHTHRVMQTLRTEQLDVDLRVSREMLEERIGKPVRALAYPVGYPLAGDARIRDAVKRAGYSVAFNAQTGPIPTWRSLDPFDLSRMAMDLSESTHLFRATMAMPLLSRTNTAPPTPLP